MTELTQDSLNGSPLLEKVQSWPHLARVIVTMVITTVVVAAIWLLVTLIAGIDSGSNAAVRLAIILGGGIVVYVYGWSVLVGFDNNRAEWRVSPKALSYLLIGVVALVFDLAMLVVGLVSADII